jgi:hypothetical protein
VTKSSGQPRPVKSVCRLSAKKLKYLKNPRSVRLKVRLTVT